MKQKLLAVWLIVAMLVGCIGAVTLASAASESQIVAEFAAFETYGKVTRIVPDSENVYIVAEGYHGYHPQDNPFVTVGVLISRSGVILDASVLGSEKQTPGYPEMITPQYMLDAYAGKAAVSTLEVDAVSGATATSLAVQYAVRTAAYYAKNVFGIEAETDDADVAELNAVYPAAYTAIQSAYAVDAKEIGEVLYAAEATAADGTEVLGLKVRSAKRVVQRGSAGTGWDAAMPSPYTMVIIIDKAASTVIACSILVDGTISMEHFAVPETAIDSYKTVKITEATAFDAFVDGLVKKLPYETESSEDGPLITGTTIVYTGATEQGTFSSQLVRNCFRTAADYFINYAK